MRYFVALLLESEISYVITSEQLVKRQQASVPRSEMDTDWTRAGISERTAKHLIAAGIDDPKHLLAMPNREIRAIRQLGRHGLAEIERYIKRSDPVASTPTSEPHRRIR
jgi:DNA-directed RNA polymerase alpha subunit